MFTGIGDSADGSFRTENPQQPEVCVVALSSVGGVWVSLDYSLLQNLPDPRSSKHFCAVVTQLKQR